MQYPAVDPIPIPAPVWLMKLLSYVTLSLHFAAVMILVGSLLLVCYFSLRGRSRGDGDQLSAAFVLARRLPVLMTWVINLGVPPLLFAQVLYGRAIYSSSVLIAVFWISIILLVMLDYRLLYRLAKVTEEGKPALLTGLIALFLTMGIGQIYSMNMTLMLRPEAWKEMYAANPSGLNLVHGDPTMMPRWLFVMAGGLVFGGLWSVLLSNMKHLTEGTAKLLRRGGLMAAAGAVVQGACAMMVLQSQSEAVRQGLASNGLFNISGLLFAAMIVLTLLLAAFLAMRPASNFWLSIGGMLTGFLATAGAVIFRDGIRDVTLMGKGYNVWDRVEHSNWFVLGLFILLFLLMVGAIIWLLKVMQKATPPVEQVAQ